MNVTSVRLELLLLDAFYQQLSFSALGQRELWLKLMELTPVSQAEWAAGWVWDHRNTDPQHLGEPDWVLSFLSSFWGQEWEVRSLSG